MKVTCVACDKIIEVEDFTEDRVERFYCCEECKNKILKPHNKKSKFIIKCKWCGEKRILVSSQFYDINIKYCSQECYWKDKKEIGDRKCEYCGITYSSNSNKSNIRFCSRECYDKHKKENSIYYLKCEYCGIDYEVDKHRKIFRYTDGIKEERKFCSKECADKARIGKYCGSDSPNWKGDLTSLQDLIRKSADYSRTRRLCFERDWFKSVISGEGGRLVHHHIKPYSTIIQEYGLIKDNWREHKNILFDLNNVVSLKDKEHKLFHSIYGKVASPENFEEFKTRFNSGEFNL